jgi:glutamyl-tRNA synthetase
MKLRFAPSPSGLLHVGAARIALANWLVARRNGGAFLLRLDDADAERCRPEYADAIQQDLAWLGLDWDECVRQSERPDRYVTAAEKLKASGRLYPCFESDEELNAKREQRQRRGLAPIYDRAMLKLTPEQRASAEAGGKTPYWRFLLAPQPAAWRDLALGAREVKLTAISDPVVIRADGTPLPPFTAAVDDIADSITHLIRGEDHLTATGIQIDIMAALGDRPERRQFGHLPVLMEDSGGKRGKRGGALSLRSLRNDGIEPAALSGYLARLGGAEPPSPEPPALLASRFDLARVAKTPPRFDGGELLALNRKVLHAMPFESAQDRLPPAATPAFWNAIRGEMDLLREAKGWWDVVAGSIIPPLVEDEAPYLHQALDLLPPEPWDDKTWPVWTSALRAASGRKGKSLFLPLRLALTGEEHGPELADLLPLMGRARVADRLRLAAT